MACDSGTVVRWEHANRTVLRVHTCNRIKRLLESLVTPFWDCVTVEKSLMPCYKNALLFQWQLLRLSRDLKSNKPLQSIWRNTLPINTQLCTVCRKSALNKAWHQSIEKYQEYNASNRDIFCDNLFSDNICYCDRPTIQFWIFLYYTHYHTNWDTQRSLKVLSLAKRTGGFLIGHVFLNNCTLVLKLSRNTQSEERPVFSIPLCGLILFGMYAQNRPRL